MSATAVRYRAEGWDEGYDQGWRDNENEQEPADNPYRTEEDLMALEERDATPDEAFELGKVAGYDEGLAEGWDEGLDAGRDRWMDSREFGSLPVNPYRALLDENNETQEGKQ